jgi:MYXO-CTERM domain-containing protein
MGRRSQSLAIAVLVLGGSGCVESPPTRSVARALGGTDAGPGCGAITYQGCCTGETAQVLHYCAGGKLVSQPCGPPGRCGWDKANSLYACGASDGADPSGKLPRACPSADGGQHDALPVPDATGQDLSSCGALGYVGCCSGSTLFFCAGGKVLTLSCATSPLCGWNGGGGFYDCGTAGQSDPSGKHPIVCAMPLSDAGPLDGAAEGSKDAAFAKDRGAEVMPLDAVRRDIAILGDRSRPDALPRDRGGAEAGAGLDLTRLDGGGGDLGEPPTGSDGCGCAAPGPRPAPTTTLGLAMLAAMVIARLRRRRP